MGFPEQLRSARMSMGFTQKQVADAMGITDSTYCGYETGKRQPDVEKIKKLARILNTTGDALLETGAHETKNPSEPIATGPEGNAHERNIKILTEALIKCGFIEPDGDLSDDDLEFLQGAFLIFHAHFKRRTKSDN